MPAIHLRACAWLATRGDLPESVAQTRALEALQTLRYGDNELTIVRQGLYVKCAVSGARIPLDELKYWSVDLQEAYRGPAEATQRWRETHPEKK